MNTISDASKQDFFLLRGSSSFFDLAPDPDPPLTQLKSDLIRIRYAIENLGEQNYRHFKRFREARFSHAREKQRHVRNVADPEWNKNPDPDPR
jgi:hypothetical protein